MRGTQRNLEPCGQDDQQGRVAAGTRPVFSHVPRLFLALDVSWIRASRVRVNSCGFLRDFRASSLTFSASVPQLLRGHFFRSIPSATLRSIYTTLDGHGTAFVAGPHRIYIFNAVLTSSAKSFRTTVKFSLAPAFFGNLITPGMPQPAQFDLREVLLAEIEALTPRNSMSQTLEQGSVLNAARRRLLGNVRDENGLLKATRQALTANCGNCLAASIRCRLRMVTQSAQG